MNGKCYKLEKKKLNKRTHVKLVFLCEMSETKFCRIKTSSVKDSGGLRLMEHISPKFTERVYTVVNLQKWINYTKNIKCIKQIVLLDGSSMPRITKWTRFLKTTKPNQSKIWAINQSTQLPYADWFSSEHHKSVLWKGRDKKPQADRYSFVTPRRFPKNSCNTHEKPKMRQNHKMEIIAVLDWI